MGGSEVGLCAVPRGRRPHAEGERFLIERLYDTPVVLEVGRGPADALALEGGDALEVGSEHGGATRAERAGSTSKPRRGRGERF
jgi:hypothetical protein